MHVEPTDMISCLFGMMVKFTRNQSDKSEKKEKRTKKLFDKHKYFLEK
jgi:hypothetical protein